MNGRASVETQGAGAWLYGAMAFALPGAGHLWQGRFARALLMGGSVWILFAAGILSGGHLYTPASAQDMGMLAYFFTFFDIGSGLLYLISVVTEVGVMEQAQRVTAEYGNVFLMMAGLLNYLTALDAFDIGARRKN
jgi:hypothetical protein